VLSHLILNLTQVQFTNLTYCNFAGTLVFCKLILLSHFILNAIRLQFTKFTYSHYLKITLHSSFIFDYFMKFLSFCKILLNFLFNFIEVSQNTKVIFVAKFRIHYRSESEILALSNSLVHIFNNKAIQQAVWIRVNPNLHCL
jgi:hypothetical protein